ncbi:MAG: DUF4080 domain-containing protein [Ruminococcaceae bacterium]|nr:DUF4080 domain-containing protein [Oscillospiraceae bacterium]
MKVALFTLNGSWSHTSLALRCLRRPLERAGFSVELLEYSLRDRTSHVLEQLYRAHADVYSFSCYIWNLTSMLELAQSLRQILPDAKIVLGGPEVSFGEERFATLPYVDAVICGEGEEALPELCQAFLDGAPYARVVHAATANVMTDEGILYRKDDARASILYYESSRGCPFRCAYCLSSLTQGVRFKSVAQTLSDLRAFEELEGSGSIIKFVDRTFNADVGRANAIWRALLDPSYTKRYHFEICASLLNEESFEILAQFPKGKIQLEIGLQSTNEETLRASSRHIDPHAVIAAVRRIHEMGNIHVHLDLIAGLPYESYTRFARSFDDAYGSCDLLQLGFLKLLHGTELRRRQEEYGYRCLPNPPYTVLASKWMSYEEMTRLSHIAETLERVVESGRFSHALYLLRAHVESPFAFFEGLTDYFKMVDPRPLQKISQPDVFRYFLQYAKEAVPSLPEEELVRMLALDFSIHEHKNPPSFLRLEIN